MIAIKDAQGKNCKIEREVNQDPPGNRAYRRSAGKNDWEKDKIERAEAIKKNRKKIELENFENRKMKIENMRLDKIEKNKDKKKKPNKFKLARASKNINRQAKRRLKNRSVKSLKRYDKKNQSK